MRASTSSTWRSWPLGCRAPRAAVRHIVLAALAVTFVAVPLWSDTVDERLDGFDPWVESIMQEWKVPGLGVAIVEDGKTVFAKGYGWRNVEEKLPVTPDTLFAIGSNTKSFTATLLAMQVDDGTLAWDDPIRTVLPEFRLHDPAATDEMTAVDLLSHRSGLPRHDLYWYATGRNRSELLAGLHHLEPSASFRSRYQYQNLMFMTAGIVSERIGGKSWEELVQERVLTPLGIDRATFSVIRMQEDDDFSYGYGADEEIERVPFRNIDAIGPAGSINMSARDLAAYVRFHLAYGKVGDEQLLKEASARLMQLPQMVLTGPLQQRLQNGPEIGDPTYGLGLMVSTYRGRKHISHGGGIDGFISAMEWLPDDKIGVIALSNTSHTGTVPALVVRNAFDRMLGLEPIDWAGRARKQIAEAEEKAEEAKKKDLAAAVADTSPSHPLADHAGEYEHEGYGKASVRTDGDGLVLEVAGIEFPLRHYHYDVWSVPYDLPASSPASGRGGAKVRFDYGNDGKINVVAVPLEPSVSPIRFLRAGD
ncbi:MAG: serine hydrolase [Acidobacteriota bacterium]|nr:serine hydrolase [Acidobacteriota bacterium]